MRWNAFLRHLRSRENGGKITSEEAVAVVANNLTQGLLPDLEERTADEDVEPPKAFPKLSIASANRIRLCSPSCQRLRPRALRRRRKQCVQPPNRVASAQAATGHIEEEHRQLTLHLRKSIDEWSSAIATAVIAVAFILLVAITTWGAIKFTTSRSGKLLSGIAIGLLAAFGVYRATWGGNLAQWRLSLREVIRRSLTARLIPHRPISGV